MHRSGSEHRVSSQFASVCPGGSRDRNVNENLKAPQIKQQLPSEGRVLQPRWYRAVRGGQATASSPTKCLQIGVIAGRAKAG